MRNWRERTVRAVLAVRWDMLPASAEVAARALSARQWDIIRLRLNGYSCADIAQRQGVSKQAIYAVELGARAALQRASGRPVPSVADVLASCKADAAQRNDHEVSDTKRRPRVSMSQCIETRMARLAERFIAGELSREEADCEGRALENALLSLDA